MSEILRVDGVTRHFPVPSLWGAAKKPALRALDGVSLSLASGETLGIVGESGSGKSTLARLALGFDRPTSGTIRLDGEDLSKLTPRQWRALRRRAQYVFQDTSGSLNPRLTVGEQIREGLDVHAIGTKEERERLVVQTLEAVDLGPDFAVRFPHQLSGGQQQRVVIARAIILRPALLVADEPVSALDLTVQAQVVALLADLQRATGTAMLFISHDLKVVRRTTARLIVLYLGRVVEEGSTASIFADARHPYTMALLAAMLPSRPAPSPARRFRLAGDAQSLRAPLSGCPLQPRCPFALDLCRTERPPHVPVGSDHKAACHRAAETPRLVGEMSQQGLVNV
jgi:oligopeptide/dipeptide ABC transporter ATP-binding protein